MEQKSFPYEEPITNPSHVFPFITKEHAVDLNKLNYFKNILQTKRNSKKDAMIYIHIPYCLTLCSYCHCHRSLIPPGKRIKDVLDDYLHYLYQEISAYANLEYIRRLDYKYIHIGGGTPSLLSSEQFRELIYFVKRVLNIDYMIPFNVEGEIRTLNNPEKIAVLKEIGTTRISFGIQTFNEDVRKLCNLKPTMKDILECIENLRALDFAINIDLLYGLPAQTMEVLEEDLNQAVDLKIDSMDIYRVNIYPQIDLFLKYRHSHPEILDEKTKFEMYRLIIDYLTSHGYTQVTDELFNLPNAPYSAIKEAINYCGEEQWDILALGSGACGMLGGLFIKNAPLNDYKNRVEDQKFPIVRLYKWSIDDIYTHMALRGLTRGLKLSKKDKYFLCFKERYQEVLEKLKQYNLIEESETEIKLTYQGIMWHQNIQLDFLTAKQQRDMKKMSYDYVYDRVILQERFQYG